MALPTSEKIIKPGDCALILGIPDSRKRFFDTDACRDRCYARRFHGVWRKYELEVAHYIGVAKMELRTLNMSFASSSTIARFHDLCLRHEQGVVVLISHWDKEHEMLEFCDGMYDVRKVVGEVPPSFKGIIDVKACRSLPLAAEIRRCRECLVDAMDEGITPKLWLYYYTQLFLLLEKYDLTYMEATESLLRNYIKRS